MGMEQRRHLRVKYPIHKRPPITLDKLGKVVDISESGLKAIVPNSKLIVGQKLIGTVTPYASGPVRFSGTVVRIVGDLIMVEFAQPMSATILKREVDHIIASYGGFMEADEH